MLTPLDIPPFAPTAKRSGDIVIHSHSAYRVVDDGSWRSLDDQPERDTRPSCEAVQSAPLRHFALCGFVLGVLIALYLVKGW